MLGLRQKKILFDWLGVIGRERDRDREWERERERERDVKTNQYLSKEKPKRRYSQEEFLVWRKEKKELPISWEEWKRGRGEEGRSSPRNKLTRKEWQRERGGGEERDKERECFCLESKQTDCFDNKHFYWKNRKEFFCRLHWKSVCVCVCVCSVVSTKSKKIMFINLVIFSCKIVLKSIIR